MDTFAAALLSRYTTAIPPELDWFGPMVGDWHFTYYGKQPTPVTGQWLFRRILRGTGIEDLLISPSIDAPDGAPETDGAYAASIRMFNPRESCYDVTYCSRQRTLSLRFVKEGNKLVGTVRDNPAERWVFSELRPNSFQWAKLTLLENGAWRTDGTIYATRKQN